VSFVAITLCVASERVFVFVVVVVDFVTTQSGNFWIYPRKEYYKQREADKVSPSAATLSTSRVCIRDYDELWKELYYRPGTKLSVSPKRSARNVE